MNVVTTGLSTGDFHLLRVLSNGQMTDILTLLGSGGVGGSVSANAPLNRTGDVLSIDLSAYASTVALNNALAAYTDTTNLTILLAGKQNTGAQAAVVLRYSDAAASDKSLAQGSAGQLLWNGAELQLKQNSFQQINSVLPISLSGSNNITIESLFKPSSVSLGAGVFGVANDTTGALALSGYDLRWLTTGVPSIAIKCLHFKTGFTVAETFNVASGQQQLDITATGITDAEAKALIANSVSATAGSGVTSLGNPTSGAVVLNVDTAVLATRALVDPEIAKISKLVASASGVSCGTGTGAGQRIALFEIPASSTFFYGSALMELPSHLAGIGWWASTNTGVPRQNGSSGVDPHMTLNTAGNLGLATNAPSERLHVVGNVLASGTISGSVKAFDIQHGGKEGWRLRHWCVEGDSPGGSLVYKRQVVAPKAGIVDIIMPKWFAWLARNVMVFSTGVRHHGTAWGLQDELDPCVLHLNVSRGGAYNLMICADRADKCATTMCPQEVEYLPAPPTQTPEQSFPP